VTPDQFRAAADKAADWIAEYMRRIREYPVLAQVPPGGLTAQLPHSGPEAGEPVERVLADFEKYVVPGITHWNHPRFFGYFSVSGSPPGILAEMLAAAVNVNAMLWRSSPAATELEQIVLCWLREWMGLPPDWFGISYDTASTSTLHAVIAARELAAPEAREHGSPPGLVLYTSEQAHSSVEKAAITAGIGHSNVRKIAADCAFRMDASALAAAVERDRAAGLRPFCVVATVGTTPTAAVDPVPAIAEIAARERLWLHIDAAYGGSFAISSSLRHVLNGCEHADSLVVNPHKGLLTQVGFSALYTKRPEILRRAFSLVPDYLATTEPGVINMMDYGFQLGRRFNALRLWFIMRCYGRRELAGLLESHVRMALEFASWVEADPGFELAAPVSLSLVCFRRKGTDEENRALLDRVNASGTALLSPAALNGRLVLRLAIGNYQTREEDLRRTWAELQG
jgi:aromatic-L-amino-acid decarboxylase